MAKIDLWEVFVNSWLPGYELAFEKGLLPNCKHGKKMFNFASAQKFLEHIKEHHRPEFLQFKKELAEALGLKELIEKWNNRASGIKNRMSPMSGEDNGENYGHLKTYEQCSQDLQSLLDQQEEEK